jgi:hypothetical protein
LQDQSKGAKRLRISRDGVLFIVGLGGIVYETLVTGGDRPTLLVLFAAMVGLPAFLRTDEKKQATAELPPEVKAALAPATPAPEPEVAAPRKKQPPPQSRRRS